MNRVLKSLVIAGCGLLIVSASMAYSPVRGGYPAGNGINNTVHDLSTVHNGMDYTAVPADTLNRICIFCHAPHNTYRLSTATGGAGPQAPSDFDYLPLWNHQLQASTAYTMYENGPGAPQVGPTASQAILNGMVPGSSSLLCLSCHDGTIAANQYGNASQLDGSLSTGGKFISSVYNIGNGTDRYLGNHHPIGFDYDLVQVADDEVRNADNFLMTPTTFIRDHLYGANNAKMECGTCHSVHNKGNNGETLLWRSDQASKLCLTCHDKGIYIAP